MFSTGTKEAGILVGFIATKKGMAPFPIDKEQLAGEPDIVLRLGKLLLSIPHLHGLHYFSRLEREQTSQLQTIDLNKYRILLYTFFYC